MYSPSGLFQLQTLQSSATGKDQTRFNFISELRVAVSGLKTQAFHVNKEQRQESSPVTGKIQSFRLDLCIRLLADTKFLDYGTIL
jgi:hypothetical protein